MYYHFITPIYRFFSEEKYLNNLVNNGLMRFTPVSAFTKLPNESYRDVGEKYYKIKTVEHYKHIIDGTEKSFGGSIDHQYRKIEDAWAFCASTSIVSTARKEHTVYIKNLALLLSELNKSIMKTFNEELQVLIGPIAYQNEDLDSLSEVIPPPYFCKPEKFKSDLEFRIVIIPSRNIHNNGEIKPIDLIIENSQDIFRETILISTRK
jgi:hypothetical protein